MALQTESLCRSSGRFHAVPFLLAASLAALVVGLVQPVLHTQKLVLRSAEYSVTGGIRDLFEGRHYALATLVLCFSLVFPLLKIAGVAWAWFRPADPDRRVLLLLRLEALGKWSMLDVFVVAILLGTVNLGLPSGAEPGAGVYVFGSAVLLSMLTTWIALWEARRLGGSDPVPRVRGPAFLAPVLALAALVCLALGLTRPILNTAKWRFWDTDYSAFSGVVEMFGNGHHVLALTVLVFAVVIPLVSLTWLSVTAVMRGMGLGMIAPRMPISPRWSMADVFTLAVLVVTAKLGDVMSVTYRSGMAWLVAGAILASAGAFFSRGRGHGVD